MCGAGESFDVVVVLSVERTCHFLLFSLYENVNYQSAGKQREGEGERRLCVTAGLLV